MKKAVGLAVLLASLTVGSRFGRFARSADVKLDAQGSDKAIKITRSAECRWTDKPPVLDGELSDPCWKNAQPIVHFASYWDKTQRTGTTAYLVWDKDALYYAGVMTDAELKAFGDHRNDSLWNGDVFELFFKPHPEKLAYFEFQANPKGTVFEVAFPGRDTIKGDFPKQPVLGSKAVVKLNGTLDQPGDRDTSWIVEGRIPWTAFAKAGGRPESGTVWRFAICRYDYGPDGTEPILMSSAPLGEAKFHLHEDYGTLKFVGPR
ncbi:MAG: hypothetical protein ABS79_05185 [Planctomycetes bacterium SCN 63-9]|nr:MAG: hypothetical protein ABS79_05185 [Planctomycetes bacterium SCN 63-9]